jgi:hypothetical protein
MQNNAQFNHPQYSNNRRPRQNKSSVFTKGTVIWSIVIIAVIVTGIFLWNKMRSGGEWVCEGDEWVMKGTTTNPRPEGECRDGAAYEPGERVKPDQEYIEADSKKITTGIDIRVMSPHVNQTIESPLVIKGEAKDWFVDDEIIVRIVDGQGNNIIEETLKANGSVEEGEYVAFEKKITFDRGEIKSGDMIFQKKNPSNDPTQSRTFSFPVFFE